MTIEPDYVSPCGSVTLYRGDCLEVMPQLEDTVDAIITDLPYGTTACKWDSVIPFAPLWASYTRLIKKNGAVVLFGSQPFTSALVMSNPDWFKYCWVWEKGKPTGFQMANYRPMKKHEDVCVFSQSAATAGKKNGHMKYHPQGLIPCVRLIKHTRKYTSSYSGGNMSGEHIGTHTGFPNSILRFSESDTDRIHPTQKPVALIEYLIKTYTNEGETVLDNTFGSGTAAIACLNTNRKFIGIERDPTYFAAAVSRVEAHIAKQAESLFVMEAA